MKRYRASEVVVVISAHGKMTNALEELIEAHATGGIEKQRESVVPHPDLPPVHCGGIVPGPA
ncbi:MAG: hypothetical protein R2751_14525 [Bacteroidales bacterium]